jgi:streptogramin lyase
MYIHLAAGQSAVLERATDDGWAQTCVAPCDGYVAAFGNYRVSIPNHAPSPAFTLPGPPGSAVSLKVDDDGTVWTHDSAQLAAERARRRAASADLLAFWLVFRH